MKTKVSVDDSRCPFTREQMRLLETELDPYSESLSFGCDIYLKALEETSLCTQIYIIEEYC